MKLLVLSSVVLLAGCGLLQQPVGPPDPETVGGQLAGIIPPVIDEVAEEIGGPWGLGLKAIGLITTVLLGAGGGKMVVNKLKESPTGKIL